MKGNYNKIAPYYDRLSKIIFGNAIVNAQLYLLDFIHPKSTILIVGGGTGWLLSEISKRHPEGLQITYVEVSTRMIELSKKQNFGKNRVMFVNEAIQDVKLDQQFDIVITPFLLDNFTNETTKVVFKKLHHHLKLPGKWLFSDFHISEKHAFWQRPFLEVMYFFFKLTCNIEANRLPETNQLFDTFNYKKISSKTFFHDFIRSTYYQK